MNQDSTILFLSMEYYGILIGSVGLPGLIMGIVHFKDRIRLFYSILLGPTIISIIVISWIANGNIPFMRLNCLYLLFHCIIFFQAPFSIIGYYGKIRNNYWRITTYFIIVLFSTIAMGFIIYKIQLISEMNKNPDRCNEKPEQETSDAGGARMISGFENGKDDEERRK